MPRLTAAQEQQVRDRIIRAAVAVFAEKGYHRATIADVVRDPNSKVSVLDLVQTPGQRAVLDRLTALMTVLEGHAEFVMDGVGPEVIPSVDAIV